MERRLSEFLTPETVRRMGCRGEMPPAGAAGGIALGDDPLITGLEYDSRKIKLGNCYFALKGLHTDGHIFIAGAVKRGAVLVVHETEIPRAEKAEGVLYLQVKNSRFAMSPFSAAYYDFPSKKLRVIGVTGTEGKSTTVYLIWQFLRLLGKKAGFISTVQYSVGDGEQNNSEHQTTPEATGIQYRLWEMNRNGAEYAVIEASSHGLSVKTNRLGDVDFDAAVITNVAHEHLEFHGTWEQYRDDKANLFRALDRKSSRSPAPFGVINGDDISAEFFANSTSRKTFTFSVQGREADLTLMAMESSPYGNWYGVLIRNAGRVTDIRDQLPGAFNAGNVLASLLVISELLQMPVRDLIPLAARLKPVRGRMTSIRKGQPFEVLVDYAHTPSSFKTIFPPFFERVHKNGGRIISLFGSAGERDTKKRAEQGRIAADYSDIMILTDEDPRGEVPMAILEEIASGAPERRRGEDCWLIPDRPQAIRKALSLARRGDAVLLLGKGHENSIIYKEKTVPYDEIGETEKALDEMYPEEHKRRAAL